MVLTNILSITEIINYLLIPAIRLSKSAFSYQTITINNNAKLINNQATQNRIAKTCQMKTYYNMNMEYNT